MKLAVIGAGWAGCSAAVELARCGHEVIWVEAGRTLGGRARGVTVHGQVLDNGQHILLGAYRSTLALLKILGQHDALIRLPLQMIYPIGSDGMQLESAKLPAPFHLLVGLVRCNGLTRADKMAVLRFFSAARWMGWEMNQDCTVTELLERFDQTERVNRLLWYPLCVAALNTPAPRASAQIFLNVLHDSLGAGRRASDMLLSRTDLSSLLPGPAAEYVTRAGGQVRTGCAIRTLCAEQQRWRLGTMDPSAATPSIDSTELFDGVVLATGAQVARQLLAPLGLTEIIPDYQVEPITTCYLQYPSGVRLDRPFLALLDYPAEGAFGQFVFDRGQIDGQPGLLAVVISAPDIALMPDHAALAEACARQLATTLEQPALRNPIWHQVITEKRATFACLPGLHRPPNRLPLTGLVLAGDYTESRYPSTLESAVQSGLRAAQILLEQNGNRP